MGEAGETPWPRGAHTGGAWLSSARVVRCWVKSRDEHNPRRVLPWGDAGNPHGPRRQGAEGGDDVKSSCPLMPWAAHVLQWPVVRGMPPREGERMPESRPQFGLGAATRPMKSELLVIADQHAAVNRTRCPHPPVTPPESSAPEVASQPQGGRRRRCGG